MPRKKAFSIKMKKKQLQDKRQRKRDKDEDSANSNGGNSADSEGGEESEQFEPVTMKLHQQPTQHKGEILPYDPNRYHLHFARESKAEVEERKRLARLPFTLVSEVELEVSVESVYKPGSVLDMPKRPPWNFQMSKEQVENNERKEFQKYLEEIYKHHKQSELSYFEHNLETWRQLWRVLEVSDIIVCLADIRHPALHFSPALYEYVLKDLKKKFILVLNKVDLVSPELVTAWKCYFQSKYEHLSVVCFSSFPKAESERNKEQGKVLSKKQRRKKFNSAVGPRELLAACSKLCGDKVDLMSWEKKIVEQERGEVEGWVEYDELDSSDESEDEIDQVHEEVETNDALLTLGFVGHTNVGKSSLLNGLVGKKVVSVSRTPGHTKHFQTIFLTPSVRLCDCPGLVFPSLVDKQLQILSGLFPISQVQEPYTAVGYLAARWPLVHMLKLVLPQDLQEDDNKEVDHKWSAWDICEAWAERRGYMTAKAARRDVYRAANSILRLAVDGKVPMYHYPPGFVQERDKWKDHPDTLALAQVQDQKSESRRQREVDEEVSELRMRLKPHSLQPRDFMESADGDDEDETAEEGGLVSNNPFALLADE